MKYDRAWAGLRLKPSVEGLGACVGLTPKTRATLIGITVYSGQLIRLQRDGRQNPETWDWQFWIPAYGIKKAL